MADYARIEMLGKVAENTAFSPSKMVFDPDNFTLLSGADEFMHLETQADTGGTTITFSQFATINFLGIKNTDGTNYVTATFRSAGNSSTNNILRIAAGGFLCVTDVTAANNLTLTANSSACDCQLIIVGT